MRKLTTILPGVVFIVMAFSTGCKDNAESPDHFISTDISVVKSDTNSIASAEASKVYVCKSTGAKKYHFNENCRGLKQCTHEVVTMSVKEAEGKGLGLCGWED
jgi:hypothetical protein